MQEKDDKEKAELEEARKQKSEADRAFLDVRAKRTDAFMKALDHVKDVIDQIYKDLTKSKVCWTPLPLSFFADFCAGVLWTMLCGVFQGWLSMA